MKNHLLFIMLLSTFSLLFGNDNNRKVYSSAGGQLHTSKLVIDFTIGETVITTVETKNGAVTQGFQQGDINIFEKESAVANESKLESINNISLFPNPTKGWITVNIENNNPNDDFYFIIYDMIGNQLEHSSSTFNSQTNIDLSKYSNGAYILIVQNKLNNTTKEFKIIKNN